MIEDIKKYVTHDLDILNRKKDIKLMPEEYIKAHGFHFDTFTEDGNVTGYRLSNYRSIEQEETYPFVLSRRATEDGIRHKLDVHILHHVDLDGDCSAALVSHGIRYEIGSNIPMQFHRYNYVKGDLIKIMNDIDAMTEVTGNKRLLVIVDLGLPEIGDLVSSFDYLIWIDHHSTSLDFIQDIEFVESEKDILVHIDTNCSAALSTAILFKEAWKCIDAGVDKLDNMNENRYIIPALVSIWDTKKDKEYPDAYPMAQAFNQYYFDMSNMEGQKEIWKNLIETPSNIVEVLCVGKKLWEIARVKNAVQYSYEAIYSSTSEKLNLKVLGIFGSGNSHRFDKYTENAPENENVVTSLMRIKDGRVIVSLYSDSPMVQDFNMATFVKTAFGGGGHPGACGFNLSLPEMVKDAKATTRENRVSILTSNSIIREDTRAKMLFQYIFSKLIHAMEKEVE